MVQAKGEVRQDVAPDLSLCANMALFWKPRSLMMYG
jgi:hypothetical protein